MNLKKTVRVCIDCRRNDPGGIARITAELRRVLACTRGVETIALEGVGVRGTHADDLEILPFEATHLSLEEYETLSAILLKARVDVFVTPQFYNTPRVAVPVVSWVHDTWPLRHPEWLPRPAQVFGKFANGSREVAHRLLDEYSRLRDEERLFPANVFLREHDHSNASPLERAVIAMFALNLQRSAKVVTCSNHTSDDLAALFPEMRDRVRVIYNPVPELSQVAPPTGGTPAPRILHVSKWEQRKNLERLVAAFSSLAASLERLELHLVGSPTTPEYEIRVRAAIRASPASGRVIVHGSVSDQKLAALYAASTVVVIPSLFEGFSLPMVEAMAIGIPVVAADVGAIPEIAGGAAELFDPYDVGSIASALQRVLTQAPLRTNLVERGRARVASLRASNFSANVEALIAEFQPAVAH
jgi:glycosyltransferase involved in cell wall biosynthesis